MYSLPCRLVIHDNFFEHLGLHLLVQNELGRSRSFSTNEKFWNATVTGRQSCECEVALSIRHTLIGMVFMVACSLALRTILIQQSWMNTDARWMRPYMSLGMDKSHPVQVDALHEQNG